MYGLFIQQAFNECLLGVWHYWSMAPSHFIGHLPLSNMDFPAFTSFSLLSVLASIRNLSITWFWQIVDWAPLYPSSLLLQNIALPSSTQYPREFLVAGLLLKNCIFIFLERKSLRRLVTKIVLFPCLEIMAPKALVSKRTQSK